jgi:hypothetical protein
VRCVYMHTNTVTTSSLNKDEYNSVYLLRNTLGNLSYAIDNLKNPILNLSEQSREHLSFSQKVAIENSFSLRTVKLRQQLATLKKQFTMPDNIILRNLDSIKLQLQNLRNEYNKSEMGFGYYVDLLHTRSLRDMGKIIKGYDHLAKLTLKIFLTRLGYSLPEVVVYIEQFGDGAAIMRADISLWDRIRNPCAVIKMPQSNLGIPRSSIFHESGHQIGSITGLNKETASLLHRTIISNKGSKTLARYWKFCATEIIADQIATHLTNWIGALTMFNIYSGAAGKMFSVIPGDTHLMGYLRIICNIESCNQAFGNGYWNKFKNAVNILYPLKNASNYSKRIIYESLPLIPLICKTLSKTKLVSLKGKSLEDIFPMQLTSPYSIKKLLTFDLSHFSIDMNTMVKYPIHTMVAFGTIQMLGKKSIIWITDEMSKWLAKLGEVEVK